MSLAYESATSGDKALGEISRILQSFGCQSYGSTMDYEYGELIVHFTYRDFKILVKCSINGYAAAWLREHPHSARTKCTLEKHQAKAKAQASISVYSMARDWIKGQICAVETGMLTFEGAFLGQILLPSGESVLEKVQSTGSLKIGVARD